MGRIGLGWLGEPDVRSFAAIASRAETAGFNSIWLAETRFTRESIVASTAVALATSSATVGTAAVNAFTRGVALLAITFSCLDEVSEGRAILGIGPGSPLVLAPQGYVFEKPVARLREYVEGTRAAWAGQSYRGEFVLLDGFSLDFQPRRPSLPIYLAVTGPRALEAAGELADGVILNAFTSTQYTKRAMERIDHAAARQRRSLANFARTGAVVVAFDDESSSGRDALRPLVATYLTGFPNIARESGLPEEVLAHYRRARDEGGLDAAAREIPDEVVDLLTATGGPDDVRLRVRQYREAGIEEPVIFASPSQFDRVLAELASS